MGSGVSLGGGGLGEVEDMGDVKCFFLFSK